MKVNSQVNKFNKEGKLKRLKVFYRSVLLIRP